MYQKKSSGREKHQEKQKPEQTTHMNLTNKQKI